MATPLLVDIVTGHGARRDRVTHVEHFPARSAHHADWPDWLHPEVRAVWEARGVTAPWTHQVEAADHAHAGRDTVIATGTASGKSQGYLLPVLDAAVRTRDEIPRQQATTLYLSPTKALGYDQYETLRSLPLQGLRPATYDGDTGQADRDWARAHANVVFTNPDMLHRAILPGHTRFLRWFSALEYVVVDEAHRYRGVFGSHVALILRRLLRIARHYGADPVVLGASATMADPQESFARLTGRECTAVTVDGSPRAAGDFVLWEPPLVPDRDGEVTEAEVAAHLEEVRGAARESDPWADSVPGGTPAGVHPVPEVPAPVGLTDPKRVSSLSETAHVLSELTLADCRSIAFIASRRGAEALAEAVRNEVARTDPAMSRHVAAYRGGYLPEERRLLETGLRNGTLRTVASTNALEVGIDISGLDVVVMAGWPGTLASLWQQAGRAGRAGSEWVAVLIARDDPLDTYVVHHPESVFGAPVDGGVIDPGNPYVLGGHLCAAAAEVPLAADDLPAFGPHARQVLDRLVAARMLRARPTGWYWAKQEDAASLTDIRGSGGGQVRIVEGSTGALLGYVDDAGAHTQSHPGAVYVHQGEQFTVQDLDLENRVAIVERTRVDYTTSPRSVTEISVESVERTRTLPSGGQVFLGTVEVTDQVVAYQMRQSGSGLVLAEHPLDLPAMTLRTTALWWTAPPSLVTDAVITNAELPGAVHAAEHAAIGLLPLFAGCDRWDIGGVSTARHPDTDRTTVFVYDGQAGGAGFAERGFDRFDEWQAATRDAIAACECVSGCPSCVQSPKCGNGNEPLDKDAAHRILTGLLGD
ncbi:DEAD/DEAH box helicase [Brevibacterium litoralis]|uniref:DEAD/DEAH box helicase n=1 Tax=Brevibacterium litoralis TaxID=3138935 RepID=UPI0032EC965F